MKLFDDLFNDRKDKGDDLLDQVAKKASDMFIKPTMDKAIAHLNKGAELMTESLEAIKNGEEVPEEPIHPVEGNELPDFDNLSKKWDSLIDQIEDQELNKYKICPSCNEAVSSENEYCPHCGAKLPAQTAARTICPYCGTENRALALNCIKCGKELTLIKEADTK